MMRLIEKEKERTCVYLADTAAFPYGDKSPDEVVKRSIFIVGSAIEQWKPSVVVIACNTISVHALGALREKFSTPIVGTVPAIRLAAEVTKNHRIGFLATDGTVAASYSKELSARYAADCTVFSLGAPDLVRFVEERIASSSEEEKEEAVRKHIEYFAKMGCDTIILGCTHFTHLYDTMQKAAQTIIPNVNIVDSRDGVARQSLKVYHSIQSNFPPLDAPPSPTAPCVYVTGEGSATWQRLCIQLGLEWKGHKA